MAVIGNAPFQGLVSGGNIIDASIEGVDLSTSAIAARLGYTPVDPGAAAIIGGTINGTTIGATTAASGAFTIVSASGAVTLNGLTASTALALDASKNLVSITNTGSGNNVLATSPTLVTPVLGTPASGNFSTGTFTWPTFNQNTTGTAAGLSATLAIASGGTGATTAGSALTSLGAYAASNPSGYTSNTGTVTSVGGTGTINGISLSGTVTTSGNLTLGGALDLSAYNGAGAFTKLQLPSATGDLSWGGAYGAGVPTVVGSTSGGGSLTIYPTGSTLTGVASFSTTGLAIAGSLSVGPSSGAGGIAVGSSAGRAQYQYINFGGSVGGTDYAWQIGRSPSGGVGPADGFYIYDLKASATRLNINGSGNVGIGTDNPTYKLHVTGSTYINGNFLQSALTSYQQQVISLSLNSTGWVKLFTMDSPGGCRVRYRAGSQNSEEIGEFTVKATYVAAGTQLTWSRQTYYHNINEIRVTGNNAGPYTVWALVRTNDFAPNLWWQVLEGNSYIALHNAVDTPGTAIATLSYPGYNSTNFATDATFSSNVGIGTIIPAAKLTVKGQTHTAPWLAVERSGSGTLQFRIFNAENTGYSASSGIVSAPWTNVIDSSNSDFMITTALGGGTGGRIVLDGKVGIGTTNPTAKLDVASGGLSVSGWSNNNSGSAGGIEIGWDGSQSVIQSYNRVGNGHTPLGFFASKHVFGTGNVGINNTDPQFKLDVNARMRVGDGTNNLVIGYWDTATNRIESSGKPLFLTSYTDSIRFGMSGGENMRLDSSGALYLYQQGAAGYGALNLVNPDAFIRLNSTGGTANKMKWDIRAISSTGAEALEFRTINDANTVFSTKLWIANGGNVGIGLTNPDEKLTVAGNIRIAGNQALIFQQASGPAVGAIRFTNSAGYQKAVIGSYYNIADEGAIEFVGPTSTTNMIFRSSGNLHIGATNDPGYRLGLASDTTGDGILIDVLSNPTIVLRDRGNSDTKIGTGSTAGLDNFYVSTYAVNHALMIRGANGFVGIGTNDPGERLTVNGSIRSTTNAINFSGQTGAQFDYYNGEMRFAVHNGSNTSIMYFNAGTGKLNVPGTVINNQGGGVGSTSRYYAAASISPTSTSGGVAIYDLYLPDYFGVTDAQQLEIYVHANPNGGGSGSYRQVRHVTANCMTSWNGAAYTPQLEYDSVNDYMGMGFDCVIFFQPTGQEFATTVSSTATGSSHYFWATPGVYLRVKVSGFNATYPGTQSLGLIVGHKS